MDSPVLHIVAVRGKRYEWLAQTYITKEAASDWREDGVEVYEVANKVPWWVADLWLTKPWCVLQDLFNFKNPWR